jgi:peptidyl-prolyl cis-trans isomerase A (cyclophilin A)
VIARLLASSLLFTATLAPLSFAASPLAAQTPTPQTSTPAPETPAAQQPAALPDAPGVSPQVAPPPVPTGPTAVIDTTMGRLTCKLFSTQSPLAVANFVGLAEGTKPWIDPVTHNKGTGKPFYVGTTFHRVIPGFMIQGGDRAGDGSGDAGYFFDNENTPGLRFDVPGRLAMANAGPNTNGSQFFITEAPQPSLDGGYSIFGQCDDPTVLTVATIARVPRNGADKPETPVVINKVTIVREGHPLPPLPPDPQNIVPEGQPPIGLPKGPPPQ